MHDFFGKENYILANVCGSSHSKEWNNPHGVDVSASKGWKDIDAGYVKIQDGVAKRCKDYSTKDIGSVMFFGVSLCSDIPGGLDEIMEVAPILKLPLLRLTG